MKGKHPLEQYRRPDIFAPGEPIPEDLSENFWGDGWPWFVGLIVGVLVAALFYNDSFIFKIIGPVVGIAVGTILTAFQR